MIVITEKDLSQNDLFKKILPELKNYFEISKALYILAHNTFYLLPGKQYATCFSFKDR